MSDRQESVLSRWARLKHEVTDARTTSGGIDQKLAPDELIPSDEPALDGPRGAADQAATSADGGQSDEELKAFLDSLPDVETLTFESDFTGFLRKEVPAALQRVALAKLWRSNPVLANIDKLNDYDDDYRFSVGGDAADLNLIEPQTAEELALKRSERLANRSSRQARPDRAADDRGDAGNGKAEALLERIDPASDDCETLDEQSVAGPDDGGTENVPENGGIA